MRKYVDYNNGFVFPGAVEQGMIAEIKPNGTRNVHAYSIDLKDYVEFNLDDEAGSIFVMVKKKFAISMLNNELDKDDDEIGTPLFHLNDYSISKLVELGKEITSAYLHLLEERSGIKVPSFSTEVFKEDVEEMLHYVVNEVNGLTEKVHCIENRLYIHRNYREEMVAQVFLFMDKEAESMVVDSIAKKELAESESGNSSR